MSNWLLNGPDGSLEFTDGLFGVALADHPSFSTDTAFADATIPRTDGVRMGEDFDGSSSVTLPVTIRGRDEAHVETLRDEFLRVWRADKVRRTPGAVVELVSSRGRSLFGRPRNPLVDDSSTRFGICRVTASFSAVSPLWWGAEQSHVADLTGGISGGLVAPLTAPLTTTGEVEERSQMVVGGMHASPLMVVFQGPVTNPYVRVGDLLVEATGSLAWDERLVVDASPWRRTVTREWTTTDETRPAGGRLAARSTPLSALALEPGEYDVFFGGVSATGDASCTLVWRDAYASY